MKQRVRGFDLSSARRGGKPIGGVLVILAAVLIGVLLLVVSTRPQPALPPTVSTPSATPSPTARPRVAPSPSAVVAEERQSDWVVVTAPTPSPVPTRPAAATPRRRPPSLTPAPSECLSVHWAAGQSIAAWGKVLVEIRVRNDCGRILEPPDIAVWVAGYRDGAVVQTWQGCAFNRLYPGRSETLTIGLPGSIDWYDRIAVEVLD